MASDELRAICVEIERRAVAKGWELTGTYGCNRVSGGNIQIYGEPREKPTDVRKFHYFCPALTICRDECSMPTLVEKIED